MSQRKVGAVIIGGDFHGLAILRSLAEKSVPICLLEDDNLCIGRFSRYRKRFIKCPSPNDEGLFLNFLEDLGQKVNLGGWVVFPTNDQTVHILSKYKERLEKYYRIPTPSWDVVKFAYDKRLTYQLAQEVGIATPRTFYAKDLKDLENLQLEFPVIIKPAIKPHFYSTTWVKAIRVDNRKELINKFMKALSVIDISEIMIQELIPGVPDYLFSFCSFFKNGEVLGKVIARRSRQHPMDFGTASYVETIDIAELEEIGKKFLKSMDYYGLSEIEFIQDPRDWKYKLLEINARSWAWQSLAIRAGVDFPYLLYQDMLGKDVKSSFFRTNIKWIRLKSDIPTVITLILENRMSISDYLNSLRGNKEFAVLSIKDPLPFIMELLMTPHYYRWSRTRF